MNRHLALILLLIFGILLSSCSDSQVDWALDAFAAWSDTNGVSFEEGIDFGTATGYAANQAVGLITNSDEYTALDMARDQINEIAWADRFMDDALTKNNTALLSSAKSSRPDDVKYQEADAVIWLVSGNDAASSSSFTTADSITARFVREGGDCRSSRLNQLRIRRKLLLDKLDDPLVKNDPQLQDKIYAEVENADMEIEALTSGQPSTFCARYNADKLPAP